jgi:transcriptional regulator with XRE-family HTH domain
MAKKLKTLGARIRDARIVLGLSQEELAKKLCIKRVVNISRWENDHNKPSYDMLCKLEVALLTTFKGE